MRDTEEVRRGVDDEEEACHLCLQRSSGPALVGFFHAEDSSTMPQVNCLRKASLNTERFPNDGALVRSVTAWYMPRGGIHRHKTLVNFSWSQHKLMLRNLR